MRLSKSVLIAVIGASMYARAQPQILSAGPSLTYRMSDTLIRLLGTVYSSEFEDSATWTQIAGTSTAQIVSPHSTVSQVIFTDTGTYRFELRSTNGDTAVADTAAVVVFSGLPSKVHSPIDQQEVEIGKPFRVKWRMDPWVTCRLSYKLEGWTADSAINPDSTYANGYVGAIWDVSPALTAGAKGVVSASDEVNPANRAEGTFVLVTVKTPPVSVNLKKLGTPIVSVTVPSGAGSTNLGMINDDYYPTRGSFFSSYDTFDGFEVGESYYGYTFTDAYIFTKLVFLMGAIDVGDGGAFLVPSIQVQQDSTWVDVAGLKSDPVWDPKFPPFTSITFTFTPTQGTGIRIIGPEQTIEPYVSCAELDVEGYRADGSAPARSRNLSAAPLAMSVVASGNKIVFVLPSNGFGSDIRPTLEIADVAGRKVRTIDCADRFFIAWDKRTDTMRKTSPGLYIARLSAGSRSAAARILVR